MAAWRSGSALVSVNVGAQRLARLVVRWVIVRGYDHIAFAPFFTFNQPPKLTQPGHPSGVGIVSTGESWRINRHSAPCISTVVSQCKLVTGCGYGNRYHRHSTVHKKWQVRCIATWGHLTSLQSFWSLITRPIMHQPTNSTISEEMFRQSMSIWPQRPNFALLTPPL